MHPHRIIFYCTYCIRDSMNYFYLRIWPNSSMFHSLNFDLNSLSLIWKVCMIFLPLTCISSHQPLDFGRKYGPWSQNLSNLNCQLWGATLMTTSKWIGQLSELILGRMMASTNISLLTSLLTLLIDLVCWLLDVYLLCDYSKYKSHL